MLLHDFVTVFLMYGYLIGNMVPFGTMISFLHDICDVPVHITKLFHKSIYPFISPPFFVLFQLMWIWFRLYSFPCIIWSLYTVKFSPEHA